MRHTFRVDVVHDLIEPRLRLLPEPGDAQGVLALIEPGGRYAARIGGLRRAEEHTSLAEAVDRPR